MFTFLYADLHAHMIALAIAMLALAWAVAVLLGKAHWRNIGVGVLSIFFGGMAIGAMSPTNLSDIYAYLPIGMVALGYTLYRYSDICRFTWPSWISSTGKRLLVAAGGMLTGSGLVLSVSALVTVGSTHVWSSHGWHTIHSVLI
jgi:uncharacterized membrane protein